MKIFFKKLTKEIDLSKVFPVINEKDYKLIEGMHLIIPDSEYKKILKEGSLKIGPYQISSSLIEVSESEAGCAIQQEITEEVEKTCLYSEDMVDVLVRGAKLKKNVIMYGKGGHNKSEGTMKILHLMKEKGLISSEPFVQAFGDGLTEESLFGGINVKKFKDDGVLEYLFDNSWMKHEIVVFEEMFDAPPQVLLSLKDILTSGFCRKGSQIYKIKTKMIIGLTNKSKTDFSEDDSLEALAQRFPLTLRVEWDSYDKKDWRLLFEKVYDADFRKTHKYKLEELVEILANNNMAKETFVSPRTAVHAADLYCAGGNLKHISDIDQNVLEQFYKNNKDRKQETADEEMFKTINDYYKENNLDAIDTMSAVLAIVMKEHQARTGEKIEVKEDKSDNVNKINKLEYLVALMNIHNWSRKNLDKAQNKIKDLKEVIVELKKL